MAAVRGLRKVRILCYDCDFETPLHVIVKNEDQAITFMRTHKKMTGHKDFFTDWNDEWMEGS